MEEEEEGEGEEQQSDLTRRASGMADLEQGQLRSCIPPPLSPPTRPHPPDPAAEVRHEQNELKPTLMRKRSMSSESVMDRQRKAKEAQKLPSGGRGGAKPKVSSLIEMFESKSPSSSPTRLRADRRGTGGGFVAAGRNKEGVVLRNSTESEQHLTRFFSTGAGGAPAPPPKPKVVVPPVPPRPLSSDGGEEGGVPVVPPRTPAPLLPPKPPGSMPPSISPRSNHRRSRSNDTELFFLSAAPPPELTPQLPPK